MSNAANETSRVETAHRAFRARNKARKVAKAAERRAAQVRAHRDVAATITDIYNFCGEDTAETRGLLAYLAIDL